MIRTCKYCGDKYDTETGQQQFCDQNPQRSKAKSIKKSIVTIGVYLMPNSSKFPKKQNA